MTLLALIIKISGKSSTSLVKLLQMVGREAPDLKPLADEWLVKLDSAVDLKGFVELATVSVKELGDIAKGKINPKFHPSDSA